jgi:hypothetical protein
VLPSGTVWDFTRSRLLTGHEQLGLQGIQMEFAHEISNNQAQDLAGNALLGHSSLTSICIGVCFTALQQNNKVIVVS